MGDYVRTEYGVICDRTDYGLGLSLAGTRYDVDAAFEFAKRLDQECVFQDAHRHDVKRRVIRMSNWSDPIWSGEHVGGCSDHCTPTTHYLEATR